MKKVTKFIMVAVLTEICSLGYAQTKYEWQKPPKPTETEIDVINYRHNCGSYVIMEKDLSTIDNTRVYNEEQLYEILMAKAKEKYSEVYPNFALRNFKSGMILNEFANLTCHGYDAYEILSASVVIQDIKKLVSTTMNKALRNVPEGSRLAIDRISSDNEGIDRETLKDQVIDMLLDKGYKIVAKDYLAKLYDEIKDQESGIYNERTTVPENNFSAVGYYINVKVTETSLRVQVVNVSTGEYEGNATVNF